MDAAIARSEIKQAPPLFVVSGGTGASGDLLARTVLAQFANVNIPIEIIPHVHAKRQVVDAVSQAADAGGALLHTMVNQARRCELAALAQEQHVPAFDLAGDVLAHLAHILEQEPEESPACIVGCTPPIFNAWRPLNLP